jgi:hypothetical protein
MFDCIVVEPITNDELDQEGELDGHLSLDVYLRQDYPNSAASSMIVEGGVYQVQSPNSPPLSAPGYHGERAKEHVRGMLAR